MSIALSLGLIFAVLIIFIVLKHKPWYEMLFYVLYLFSFLTLLFAFLSHGNDYDKAIDIVDDCYTPLGGKHFISMLFYFVVYQIAMYSLWTKGRNLPPLYAVLCFISIFIGLILNVLLLVQIAGHNLSSFPNHGYNPSDFSVLFYPTIVLSLFLGIYLVIKTIKTEITESTQRTFKNKFLNRCNDFLSKRYDTHVWAIILMLPIFVSVTIVLMLLGQDYNSLVKVFTETTTWTFSQRSHPDPIIHQGHYLCTVSAYGSPKLVKPIRLGKRCGTTIVVNRQLQIANAFEELVSDFSPKLHRFIRHNYDKYGYDLSKKINTEIASNITYILMKPLEWFFLICLYLFVNEPENKISRQYSL